MEIKSCGKGHYYIPSMYSSCPECARENNMVGTDFGEIEVGFDPVWETCPRGHRFLHSVFVNCPYCGDEEKYSPMDPPWRNQMPMGAVSLTETAELKNTVIFAADRNMSYRLWNRNKIWHLTVQVQLIRPWPVLEETVTVSAEAVNRSLGKILQEVYSCNAQAELKGHAEGIGDTRLWISIRQFFLDYRGNSWTLPYSAKCCIRTVHTVLGDLFENNQKDRYQYNDDNENLVAEVEHQTTNCALLRSGTEYILKVSDITYYDFTKGFRLWQTVRIPADGGEQLLECLAESGAMEVLIQKSRRPDDMIHRDPATATVFYLRNRGLTYSYRDWDKANVGRESEALSQAMQEMLSCFRYYRNPGEHMSDIPLCLP